MPLFPLFIDLKGKKCVIVGGGRVATRKIESLVGFEAEITVVSPEITGRIQELEKDKKLCTVRRGFEEGDLEGAFMAIAAASDRQVNQRVYGEAVKRNIHVNVADDPQKCTFVFPSLVKRNDLVVGISTSRSYPALSKKIRQKIEEVLPGTYGERLEILKDSRIRAEKEVRDIEVRKKLLDRILEEVLLFEAGAPEEQLISRLDRIFGEYGNEKVD
ncbi:MAG: bifunctional precorrin-2 dehydrogenase/sirohydrochlorin ferrochelatase [Clostridiales bacterium]|nr:bifunctional precorrin-2 dehydrogenase/sirohydrochlorin ferrochelatase [Eubacteriales bacterium]MDH7565733.1 bifunctional precorrin-2 dehydrogenase/sirohydrochlorin ferrochelatase [Clostridiales bacterium]